MTIHALEAGDPLVVDEVRKYPTAHPRCGTEFLVVVIALSIVAFSLVGRQEPLVMIGSRILPDPGDRGGRLRDPEVGREAPRQPDRPGDHVPGHPRPEDHDAPADRRHDRGRDRVDGAGAPGRRRGASRRLGGDRSSATRCEPPGGGRAPRAAPRPRSRPRHETAAPVTIDPPHPGGAMSRRDEPTRPDLDARLAEVAAPVRRRPGRARHARGHQRTPTRSGASARSCRGSSRSSQAFRRLEATRARARRRPRAARRRRRRRRDAGDGRRRDRPADGRRGRGSSTS